MIYFDACLLQIVFLGNGRSGKTSLLRTLAKKPLKSDENSTRGVTVDAFADDLQPGILTRKKFGRDLEMSFWDFAGQLEYSAAHEFFLSERQAVYVVVYNVLEDDDSIQQQLLYWLSVIPKAESSLVRLVIVGTKIDLVPHGKLREVLRIKRRVIQQVVDAKGLAFKVQAADILFTTSSQNFKCDDDLDATGPQNWKKCRRTLKDQIYAHCESIFANDEAQAPKYPKDCKKMSDLVTILRKDLRRKQMLPCCKLDHDDAVKVLGSIWRGKDKEHRKNYYKTDLMMQIFEILNDLGIIVLYDRGSPSNPSVPSVCLEPQYLPGIMSLLVDPQTFLPAATTVDALMYLMQQNSEVSRISDISSSEIKIQLLQLLVSVGIVHRLGNSQNILVPLALRGRPECWSQIIRGRASAKLVGQRLGISPTASVPAAVFMKLMLNKCVDEDRRKLWGCAFAYDVDGQGDGDRSGRIFVRLREDRRSVDVVALMDAGDDIEELVQLEVNSIARFLGKDFNGPNDRMQLCPMCLSADFFVRSGAVHAFHMQEVREGGALVCSRYHHPTADDCIRGKFTVLEMDALPHVYPSHMQTLRLPWKRVAQGGIIIGSAAASDQSIHTAASSHAAPVGAVASTAPFHQRRDDSAAAPEASSSACSSDVAAAAAFDGAFHDGMFTDVSFFVLTGQVAVGDTIAAADLPEFMRHMSMCVAQDCSCDVALSSGARKTLRFNFNIGEIIPNPYAEDIPIHSIFPSDIGDRALDPQAPRLLRFCAHDNVLVVFGPIRPKTKYLVFPGTSASLYMCRLTPALCRIDALAACCWSELQVRMLLLVLSCGGCRVLAALCLRTGPIFRCDGSRI